MRIATNFASPVQRQVHAWRLTLLSAVGLLIGALGILLWQGHADRAATADLRAELDRYRNTEANASETPPSAALEELRRRVEALRQVAAPRGLPIRSRIAMLEAQLPDPVWLVRLHHEARSGALELMAESTDVEALSRLMLRLEQSGQYSKVLLTRQSQRDQNGRRYRRFEIRLETP